jgi:hypothetical protein
LLRELSLASAGYRKRFRKLSGLRLLRARSNSLQISPAAQQLNDAKHRIARSQK